MPKIVIDTDGTSAGTKVTIDGTKVNNLVEVSLYADSVYMNNVSFSYTTKKKSPSGDGMASQTRYSYEPSKGSFKGEDCVDMANPRAEIFAKM
jgi:hypothetical protein